MRLLIFIFVLMFTLPCYSLEIGGSVPSNAKKTDEGMLTSPSSIESCFLVKEQNIEYIIASDLNGFITYIQPKTESFETSEGIKVGSTLSEVQAVTTSEIIKIPGWAFTILLPSGWQTAFTQGSTMTEGKLKSNLKVNWLFKRTNKVKLLSN